jgi:hypothetical protein
MYVLRRHVTETAGVIYMAYGTERLISKYMQPLLGNAFADRHIPMETIGVYQ